MRIGVLGSLEVVGEGGRVLVLGGATQRRLLAVLVAAGGRVVSTDRLCDVVGMSEGALRTAVSRLRRVVSDEVVVTEPPGYAVRGAVIDAARVDMLVSEARAVEPERALVLLDEAVALWRGDAYVEFADEDWARPEAVRLMEVRATAVEDVAEALLELGRFGEAIARLQRHGGEHRLRDRPCGLLMRALAGQGRQAEALRVFQEHRGYLNEELGVEPSAELRALERRIAAGWVDPAVLNRSVSAAAVNDGPSGVVTFLFTDIEGSTRLWEADPDSMQQALARHDAILRAAVERHDGAVFSTAGDGIGAAFRHASGALAAAADAQRSLTAEQWPETAPIRVRMGIHTGESHERDGDYFGPPVNRAARVMAVGHGGQILVSGTTAGVVSGVDLQYLGEYRLRDLAGVEHLFQVRADGIGSSFPPLRTVEVVPGNLPVFLTTFVGRAVEVERLAEVLADHRLVTLVGAGGIGKTRLAVQTAAGLVDRFVDGVWLVELAQVHDPGDVASMAASTVGAPATADGGVLAGIVAWFRSQHVLVVLDNCEHVIDAAGELAVALVTGCPHVTVVATSREGLAVPGEQVWPVVPLAVAGAVALFDDRAREVAPGFDVDADRGAVEEICRRLDGVPLAIELAAARVQSLAPADIASLLGDRFRLLSGGRRATVERQRTLRATVEWSFDLLDEPGRVLFARLSVFSGWFDLGAARAVCGFDPLDSFLVVEGLERLVERSMVVVEDRLAGRRYRLLETLRQFGLERLATGGADVVAERHALHHRDWLEALRHDLEGPDEVRAVAGLDDGWDNLRTAHAWTIDHADTGSALRMVAALVWEAWWRHRFEAAEWAQQAIALPDAHDHPDVIDALVTATLGRHTRQSTGDTVRLIERAVRFCQEKGWEPTTALRVAQSREAWSIPDLDTMRTRLEEGVARARRDGDHVHEAQCLTDLSTVHGFNDDAVNARRLADDAIRVAQATGNPTARLQADANAVMMLPDHRDQLAPTRAVLSRAEALRNRPVADIPAVFVTGLEARAGDPTVAARELLGLLRRLVDTDALGGWYFMAPDIFFVLARNNAFAAAAIVHGHAERYLAVNPARAHDDEVEVDLVAQHLPANQIHELEQHGRLLTPDDMVTLVLTELDRLTSQSA